MVKMAGGVLETWNFPLLIRPYLSRLKRRMGIVWNIGHLSEHIEILIVSTERRHIFRILEPAVMSDV